MKKFSLFFTIFSLLLTGDEALARHRKKPQVKIIPTISAEYFFQVNLSQSECEKFAGGECFRRDKMRDEPYYHQTKITIFRGKVFAEQFSKSSGERLFLKVRDGSYEIASGEENLISFAAKNGEVSDLKLLKGDLTKEKKLESRCDLSEAIYGFHQAYDPSQIIARSRLFQDEYNFDGLKELLFFVEKNNQTEVMALVEKRGRGMAAIKDIRLCKKPSSENYFLKHVSDEECQANREENVAECLKYSACTDYLVVKNCDVLLLADPIN